ncbi:hypothetical protein ACH5RR_032218 [Cinchona calisaya]|uniref:NB-ARC domain-containing protein n=1 Tax=Cinchona calisaya TaxID=153742 RepID=A0ABD2YIU7_9GENT
MPSVEASIAGGSIGPCFQTIPGAFMYLKGKYDSVKKIEKNFQRLVEEEERFLATKSTLEERISRKEIHLEPTPEAITWLQQVGKMETEVQGLKTKYENVHNCLCGMWPFFKLMKLSKDITKKTEELNKLKMQIDINNALMEKKPEAVEIKLSGGEDDIPLSLAETVEKLLKFLADEDVSRIAMWGMAGVGKSTILRSLNDKAYEIGMFDTIIWVRVQEQDTLKNIQLDIMARLKLTAQSSDSTEHVADIISRALEKLNYLLLLDQLLGDLNLNDVGIREKHKRGKVVVASRGKLDCARMNIHRLIKVSKLSDGDSWELFRKTAGHFADHPHLTGTAVQILKQLGGLPFAIKAVATRLKDQPEPVWNDALWALQSPNVSEGHWKELYKAFEFSYNRLPDDWKKCLLYGALFPDDYEIDQDYLTECWRSEQFIPAVKFVGENNDRLLRASRDRGHSIVQALTEASLFELSTRTNCLTMPTPFRKIALTFPYPQEGCSSLLVRGKEALYSPPEVNEWRDARWISLMCNEISSLNQGPECPKTTTLLLQRNKQLVTIHDFFFTCMTELRVLDLYHTKIKSLPPSVIHLVNLKSLYLNECRHLVSLSEDLRKLTSLEILDVQDTGLQSLPIEVAQLVSLRCLRASFVYKLHKPRSNGKHHVGIANEENQQIGKIIPSNLISELHRLEELTIIIDPREQCWNHTMRSVVDEIIRLESLTFLFLYFPDTSILTSFTNNSRSWNNNRIRWQANSFRAFRIIVGSKGRSEKIGLYSSRGRAERHLIFSADENVCCQAIQKVLRQSSAFELIGNQAIQNLSDIDVKCMESLEVCVIEDCDQICSIIMGISDKEKNAFPFLEKLHLVNLKSLSCIWDGSAGPKSFSNLTILTVHQCHKMTKLFSCGVVENLIKLRHVTIQNCSGVEEVIETDEALTEVAQNLTGFLPKLEILELADLPRLVSICKNESLDWRSLQKLEIIECSNLNIWSKGMYNAKHLSRIECTEKWWGKLQLPDGIKSRLTKRCYFIQEEPPSVYYTPREDGNYQDTDLRNLAKVLEENRMRHGNAISEAASSSMSAP